MEADFLENRLMEVQVRPRELCALCVMEVTSPSTFVQVKQSHIDGEWVVFLQGQEFHISMQQNVFTDLYVVPGYPGRFADVAWMLDRPDTIWLINGSQVRLFAEADFFGLRVCYSHVYGAAEMWRNASRVRW